MIAKEDIKLVKSRMEGYVGSRVKVRANKGRRKVVVREGVLEKTYPSIFVVKVQNELQDSYRRVSYSYTDLLTHTVELSLCQE
ncbi:MAG: Veg family protein [Eubacteriales bacterium]